jgi:anti-sigma factor RsiW
VDCFETRKRIPLYDDDELDVERAMELQSHLSGCPACAAAAAAWRGERASLAALMERHVAPGALRRRMEALTAGASGSTVAPLPRRPVRWNAGPALALGLAGFAMGVMLTLAGVLVWQAKTPDAVLLDAAVSAHVRSLMAENHLTDVVSTDRHVVKPWFAGKLDFSPPVPDLAPHGFELVGGRLERLAGGPAAALVYRIRRRTINVFIARGAEVDVAPVRGVKDGFNVVRFSREGMRFMVVSDLNGAELAEFAALLAKAS